MFSRSYMVLEKPHPQHGIFHALRLLVGSLLSGWTGILVLFLLGFLGSIQFSHSMGAALSWILVGGSLFGAASGAVLWVLASLVKLIFPLATRNIHPLALVRGGFLLLNTWALFGLVFWPWVKLAPWAGFFAALFLSWLSIRSNPRAELIPHSTLGRLIGTSTAPLAMVLFLLIIVIPMYNRGLGIPHQPRLVLIALDGVDGNLIRQFASSLESARLPNLSTVRTDGVLGTIESTQPLIGSKLWADALTGTGDNGIFDSRSSAADLSATPLWEVATSAGWRVGLFRMSPVHDTVDGSAYDIPPPESEDSARNPISGTLDLVRRIGRSPRLPDPWHSTVLSLKLVRLGVSLDTIESLVKEIIWEQLTGPSPRLIYAQRKLLEFEIESQVALGLMRTVPSDAVFVRLTSLEPLFLDYLRFTPGHETGSPPQDVDFALTAGLARVLPDSAAKLDNFLGSIQPFLGENSLLCIVSNHGVRTMPSGQPASLNLSPHKLIEIAGLTSSLSGEVCGENLCFRATVPAGPSLPSEVPESVAPADSESPEAFTGRDALEEFERLMRAAVWRPAESPQYLEDLFIVVRQDGILQVSLQPGRVPDPESTVTIGGWTDKLEQLLVSAEPRTAVAATSGLFALRGPQIRRGTPAGGAGLLDLMPTLLRALNLPISQELPGRVLEELFDPQWIDSNPASYVPSYSPDLDEQPQSPSSGPQLEPAGGFA